ncbi:DUF4435 domain-containing protein [Aureimonas sp. N4]|uniref:DUF4435 domain-containing protein n=1 Tax=Aureimonas sp. N4 TaxID=1638165 RepID=UPI000782C26F|nr:DUF4435 domain-containing protein [Aureimonas sp. N4]
MQEGTIFVFEGKEDKPVYLQWIRAICPELKYEPILGGTKRKSLSLRRSLQYDLGNLRKDVYFFVDRDFDELQGQVPGYDIFVTDRYSIENYLVERDVIEQSLIDDFHFHGSPAERKEVLDLFDALYDKFLAATKEINFRLFVSKILPIHTSASLPDQISELVDIRFDEVQQKTYTVEEYFPLEREPTEEEAQPLRESFECLDPRLRFRGKFAFDFLMKWMRCLQYERSNPTTDAMLRLDPAGTIRVSDLTLAVLASRSQPPKGLKEFLRSIETPS